MNFGPYSTKNVRVARGFGREGDPMSAVLYRDGTRIGEIVDRGDGGAVEYRFNREAAAALSDYCKTLPPEPSDFGQLTVSVDFFLGTIMEEALNEKEEKRILKRFYKQGMRWARRTESHGEIAWIAARTREAVEGAAPPVDKSNVIDIEAAVAR